MTFEKRNFNYKNLTGCYKIKHINVLFCWELYLVQDDECIEIKEIIS